MLRFARHSLLLIATVVMVFAEFATAETVTPPSGRRVALSGYDPVAYFTLGHPEKGSEKFWFAFDDGIYQFKNAEHRAMFAAEPERYAPQYAGLCAAGLSNGYKHEADPEAWAIVNSKLYVMALKERIEQFKRDPDSFINKADANWQRLRNGRLNN
jgi:hypothetical protein